MFYQLPQTPVVMPNFQLSQHAPSPLQWLSALNPYQQALIMPLLQQVNPQNSASAHPIVIDEQTANFSQLFAPLKPYQPHMFGEGFYTESTQENSPFMTFQNINVRPKSDSFSQSDLLFCNQKQKINYSSVPSIHHPMNQSDVQPADISSKKAKKVASKQSSIGKSNSACISLGLDDKDDKNIIHINFTKNLLKSFKRYCEYYHKSNSAMLQAIKSDFETSHMNNQLLVHFMTSTITMDAFKQFVNGPAQKWVKEQSRLKKQDQQLELIEICRNRLFEKIKVKKYSESVAPGSIEDNNTTTQAQSLIESQNSDKIQLTIDLERPISQKRSLFTAFKSDLTESDKESNSDSMSSSGMSDGKTVKVTVIAAGSVASKRQCRSSDKMVVLHEEVETKIEEFEQSVKVEDGNQTN